MKRLTVLTLLLAVTGCASDSVSPRAIDVSSSSVQPASHLAKNIDGLLQKTSKSYVTLVVHDRSTEEISRAENQLADAVTSGSGFVVDPAGYVLTAGHVAVAPGWRVQATGPDGRTYKGRVIKILNNNDVALIRLERASGVRAVVPVADPCMKIGESVFSLGKPRKSGDTARLGEVASMSFGRPVTYQQYGYPDAMVLKLSTRKGESGGPVFNQSGQLTGMLVSTLSDSTGRHLNLAHAVPAPDLARFVCGNINCSQTWRKLAALNTKSCPATRASR